MNPEIYPTQTMMERARNVLAEHPMAVYGSAFVLALGVTARGAVEAPNAFADDTPPTGQTGSTGPEAPPASTGPTVIGSSNPNLCPEFPAQPCDMGNDPATFDNEEVVGCQAMAIGDAKNSGMILSAEVNSKKGSKKGRVTTRLSQLENWSVYAYAGSCASVTGNKVKQRLVAEKPNKKNPKKPIRKTISKSKTLQGSATTAFVATHFNDGGDITRNIDYKMSRPLKKGEKLCVKSTITSEPLIQRPHIDPYNRPEFSVLGPMKTQTRTIYTCAKKKQSSKTKRK